MGDKSIIAETLFKTDTMLMDASNVTRMLSNQSIVANLYLNKIGKLPGHLQPHKALETTKDMKEVLGKLGINRETPESYRLMYYQDGVQTLFFKANMDDKGKVTLTEKLEVQNKADVGNDKLSRGDIINALITKPFTKLPVPIQIENPGRPKPQMLEEDLETKGEVLDLSEDAKKKLSMDIILSAAMQKSGDVQLAQSNAKLPGIVGGSSLIVS